MNAIIFSNHNIWCLFITYQYRFTGSFHKILSTNVIHNSYALSYEITKENQNKHPFKCIDIRGGNSRSHQREQKGRDNGTVGSQKLEFMSYEMLVFSSHRGRWILGLCVAGCWSWDLWEKLGHYTFEEGKMERAYILAGMLKRDLCVSFWALGGINLPSSIQNHILLYSALYTCSGSQIVLPV